MGPSTSPDTKQKKGKKFLDKKHALQLASSIADVQEVKVAIKHQSHLRQPRPDRKARSATSKEKLKEAKALISSARARSKKEKAKQRKHERQGKQTSDKQILSDAAEPKIPRKKVSFA